MKNASQRKIAKIKVSADNVFKTLRVENKTTPEIVSEIKTDLLSATLKVDVPSRLLRYKYELIIRLTNEPTVKKRNRRKANTETKPDVYGSVLKKITVRDETEIKLKQTRLNILVLTFVFFKY